MSLRPHSDAWYERLASMQAGYFYPWSSTIAPGNGEDAYLDLVRRHLSPNLDVLDAGCGDGELTFGLAPLCRTIHGYDRVQRFIDIAVAASRERGVDNARFIHFDSHSNANDGHVYVPVPDTSIDVVVSRRGPTHWIEDVRRFCRPGATLIQLNPSGPPLRPCVEPRRPGRDASTAAGARPRHWHAGRNRATSCARWPAFTQRLDIGRTRVARPAARPLQVPHLRRRHRRGPPVAGNLWGSTARVRAPRRPARPRVASPPVPLESHRRIAATAEIQRYPGNTYQRRYV